MNEEEDNQIMQKVKQGDLSGLGPLFERYHVALIGYLTRMSGNRRVGEDLAQETFWRIARYRRSFDSRRSFRGWMFQIARNQYLSYARKSATESRIVDHDAGNRLETAVESGVSTIGQVERTERSQLLREALARLPEDKRELIVLCRFEELPQAEIARALGCSVGAVKVRLFRALQELKAVVMEMEGERVS